MKLRAIGILKEALKVFAKNSNLVFLAALTSLPLFLFSIYFENRLQSFLLQASQFLRENKDNNHGMFQSKSLNHYFHSPNERYTTAWSLPLETLRKLSDDHFREFWHLGFLYLVPFNLLQLVALIFVVDSASKLYREEQRALTLKDMFGGVRILSRERLLSVFVTFFCVVFFSTCLLCLFSWVVMTYCAVAAEFPIFRPYQSVDVKYFVVDFFIHSPWSNMFFLIGIYLVWSGIWNLGIVVSVLEGKYVAQALGSSSYLCLRNLRNGMVLMLVFSLWEMGLRLLGFGVFFSSFWLEKRWVFIVAQSGLLCLGSALKWVCFVVYFEDCVNRLFWKKIDVGGEESL